MRHELYESQITPNIHLNIQKSPSFLVSINDVYWIWFINGTIKFLKPDTVKVISTAKEAVKEF